jgi:hydrogenase expression/formation protein HypC
VCLGIPGEVVEVLEGDQQLARVDVAGVRRVVNVGLVADDGLAPGDWVLIHVGFAMAKIDEAEAELALASLRLMGQAYDDEVRALAASRIEAMLDASNGEKEGA